MMLRLSFLIYMTAGPAGRMLFRTSLVSEDFASHGHDGARIKPTHFLRYDTCDMALLNAQYKALLQRALQRFF